MGTTHTWPPLLAALSWLVDLIEHDRAQRGLHTRDQQAPHVTAAPQYSGEDGDDCDQRSLSEDAAEGAPPEGPPLAQRLETEGQDRVFYEYVSESYGLFLAGDDEACAFAASTVYRFSNSTFGV